MIVTSPYFTFLIFIQCPGRSIIWRKKTGLRFKAGKFFCNAVKKKNACSSYYHPNKATAVFKNSGNQITTNRSRIIGIKLVSYKTIAVVFTQTVISTKPKEAFTVLHTANSCIIGEPQICCNMLEPELLSLDVALPTVAQ